MKRLLTLFTVLTLPASIGFAQIGETWSECDARYGKPARMISIPPSTRRMA